jgi:hypothetical protein
VEKVVEVEVVGMAGSSGMDGLMEPVGVDGSMESVVVGVLEIVVVAGCNMKESVVAVLGGYCW